MYQIYIIAFWSASLTWLPDDSYKSKKYDERIFNYQLEEVEKKRISKDEYLILTKPFSKWDSRPRSHEKIWILGQEEVASTVPNFFWGAFANYFGISEEEARNLPDRFVKEAFLNKEMHKQFVISHYSEINDLIALLTKSNKNIFVKQNLLEKVDDLIYENEKYWQFEVPHDSPFPISDHIKEIGGKSFSVSERDILGKLLQLKVHGIYKKGPFVVLIKDGMLDNSYGFIFSKDNDYKKLGHLFRIKFFEQIREHVVFYIAS